MYVMCKEDSSFKNMHYVARMIAYEVEELGGIWGAFVYNDEMAVAKYNDGESAVSYFEIDIGNNIDISVVRNRTSASIRGQYECSHEHDCCGCWFLSGLSIVRHYYRPDGPDGCLNTYIVRISTGRNV